MAEAISREQEIQNLRRDISRLQEIETLKREIAEEDPGFFSNFEKGFNIGLKKDIPRQARTLSKLVQGKARESIPEEVEPSPKLELSLKSIGHHLGRGLGVGLPSLGGSLGGAAGGAALGTAIMPGAGTLIGGLLGAALGGGAPAGIQTLADVYNEAIHRGLSHEDALKAAEAAGISSGAINALGAGLTGVGGKALMSAPLKGAFPYVAKQMGLQGAVGGTDVAAQNLIAKEMGIDPNRDILQGVPEAAALSAAIQGPSAIATPLLMKKAYQPKINLDTSPLERTVPTPTPQPKLLADERMSSPPQESVSPEGPIGPQKHNVHEPLEGVEAPADVELAKKKIFGDEKKASWFNKYKEGALTFLENPLTNIEYLGFNNLTGAKKAGEAAGFNLESENIPYRSAKFARNTSGQLEAVFTQGQPVLNKEQNIMEIKPDTKGLLQILDPLTQSQKMLDDFQAYSYGRRVVSQDLISKGKEKNISQTEAERLVNLQNEYPEFKQVFDNVQEFKKALTDFGEDGGIINRDERKIWEQVDHMPFYGVDDKGNTIPLYGSKNKLAGQKSPIHKLTGGETEYMVKDSAGNILEERFETRQQAEKAAGKHGVIHEVGRQTGNMFDNLATNAGLLIERTVRNIAANRLVDDGIKAGIVKPIEKPVSNKKDNTVQTLVNGKPAYFQVEEPLLFAALNDTLTPKQKNIPFLNMFEFMKNMISKSIVITPTIQFGIALKDLLHSHWVGKYAMPKFKQQLANLKTAFDHNFNDASDPRITDIMAMGAHSAWSKSKPKEVTKRLYDKAADYNKQHNATLLDSVLHWIDPRTYFEILDKFGRAAELGVRLSKYDAAVNAGLSKGAAGFESLDYMDYKNKGAADLVQLMGQTVPFSTTHLAGIYKYVREMSHNEFINRTTKIAGVVAMASILNALQNLREDDNEEDAANNYWSLPQEFRDNYFVIDTYRYVGKKASQAMGLTRFITYPKPWEVGVMTMTLPENLIYSLFGKYSLGEAASKTGNVVEGALQIQPFGQPLIKTGFEQFANRKAYTDIPIVPRSRENLEPSLQYGPKTSPIAKLVGQMLNVSPDRLEHEVNGLVGISYLWPMIATDIMIKNLPGAPEASSTKLSERSFINKFLKDTPLKNSGFEREFYDLYREADTAYKTVQRYEQMKDVENLQKYVSEKKGMLGSYKELQGIKQNLSEFHDAIMQIEANPEMSSDAKRKMLDNIYNQRNIMLYRFHRMKKRILGNE